VTQQQKLDKKTMTRSASPAVFNQGSILRLLLVMCTFSLAFSNPSMAVDCAPDFISLTSQAQADSFVTDYGTCDTIVGGLNITSGPFADLAGLENITSIGGFLNIQQVNIASLSGLHNLASITGQLTIEGVITLSSLSGLSSLTTVGSLSFEDSNFITSFNGLGSLSGDIQSISIISFRVLTNLNGLPASLGAVGNLVISSNDTLQSLDGLPAITGLGGLSILENPELVDISALSNSTFDSGDSGITGIANNSEPLIAPPFGGPAVSINGNPKLTGLEGLPALPPSLSGLVIESNPLIAKLVSMAGVLEIWGDLGIFNNTTLSDCSDLTHVLDDIDDGQPGPNDSNPEFPPDIIPDFFGLGSNASGCNTIEEILNTGNSEGIFSNGFEGL